jgi:cold shock CspA family protein
VVSARQLTRRYVPLRILKGGTQLVEERLFAVFVDGENASYKLFTAIIAEIESQGTIAFRRVYGDWTNPALKSWEKPLQEHGARPFQQFHYDKDSTDNSIVMDAMETILTNPRINAVCIVGSDHIYHSIAMRVRERGLYMLGIGNRETPRSFVDACHNFVYFDNLWNNDTERSKEVESPASEDIKLERFLVQAVRRAGGDRVSLATVGHHIKQMDPAFDARTYGHDKLLPLFQSYSHIFQIEPDQHTPSVYYVTIRMPDERANMTGTVIKWFPSANYGFIEAETGTYYFHGSNLGDPKDLTSVKKGQQVTFSEFKRPDPEGKTTQEKNGKASNVRLQTP